MKNVLVTGGAGYIGSHTCKALARAGYHPIAFDNLSLGHEYAVKWGPLIQGDLRDRGLLASTFKTYSPIAVLHFASDALVFESMQNPAKYYDNNVGGSLALLEAMRDHGVNHLIFSSTCATYGQVQSIPIEETHPQNPINPYGRTKLIVEQMMADFERSHQLRFAALRYFNASGADLEGEIGEDHTPETHLIPSVLQAALGQRKEISVFGTDFNTPDGSALRDYTHVQDLAEAHVLALQWILENKRSEAFNLGTGTSYSVLEIIRAVEKHYGKKLPVKLEKKRGGEPAALMANIQKAKKILNWTPSHSSLTTLIETAARWHEDQIHNKSLL